MFFTGLHRFGNSDNRDERGNAALKECCQRFA
jgi:hypothetical protein